MRWYEYAGKDIPKCHLIRELVQYTASNFNVSVRCDRMQVLHTNINMKGPFTPLQQKLDSFPNLLVSDAFEINEGCEEPVIDF